ncbi:LacI family DNA-binding transcriptional regulator [Kitasatospora sp. NBC_01539]|uniref:LacI family DNA-binding transcriptional regulator n=1 Tax=Kitasatospora sp. NBC_01539 TaxID=2903577 RepID=UPI0038602AA3
MPRQPTMTDIARRAGVSRVAVSYALNGRPGVSDVMRDRILHIAREIGFDANGAARAMHGAAAPAIGMTMRRASSTAYSVEVFRREFVSGVQGELMARNTGLALQFVSGAAEEMDVYRRWHAERRVGGVLVCDLEPDDPRVPGLHDLGLPAVVVGGPAPGGLLGSVGSDDATAVAEAVAHLAGLGHRRITRVSGPAALLHSRVRDEAFRTACRAAGAVPVVVGADYSGDAGAQATRRLLSSADRPTAVAYDNDVMAVAGLAVAREMGVAVPGELSIVAFEDSPLCQAVRPALTVLRRDIVAYGARAARQLFEAMDGAEPRAVLDHTARLTVRASTGPVPGPAAGG